ncbi:MAG: NADH-quinone oxidoreductase subunit J [Zavarzinella sp.]
MNTETFLFYVVASCICCTALGVLFTRNIVRSAFWLLLTLISLSMLYFLVGADFLGTTQLIVYVGGIMVLLVFGIMLTAQRRMLQLQNKWQETVVVSILAVSLFAIILYNCTNVKSSLDTPQKLPTYGEIGVAFLTDYLLPFEILSIHLLVVLIGAAYLARTKKRKGGTP